VPEGFIDEIHLEADAERLIAAKCPILNRYTSHPWTSVRCCPRPGRLHPLVHGPNLELKEPVNRLEVDRHSLPKAKHGPYPPITERRMLQNERMNTVSKLAHLLLESFDLL